MCLLLQAYLWDNNQAVVEWLEKHLSTEDGTRSVIRENIKYLKRENALKHIRGYVQGIIEDIIFSMFGFLILTLDMGMFA